MINMGVEDAINVLNTTNLKANLRNKHLEELDKHIHFISDQEERKVLTNYKQTLQAKLETSYLLFLIEN